jgi:hypothetical protein
MFKNSVLFNGDISTWYTINVRSMESMFEDAHSFNCDISGWNVRKVKSMKKMFRGAYVFNQNITMWVITSVKDMRHMFEETDEFNQDISKWMFCNNDLILCNANGYTYVIKSDKHVNMYGHENSDTHLFQKKFYTKKIFNKSNKQYKRKIAPCLINML